MQNSMQHRDERSPIQNTFNLLLELALSERA